MRNPDDLNQLCERIGKCGNNRKHQAVVRPGNQLNSGKATLIDFVSPDQHFVTSENKVQLTYSPIQGSLW